MWRCNFSLCKFYGQFKKFLTPLTIMSKYNRRIYSLGIITSESKFSIEVTYFNAENLVTRWLNLSRKNGHEKPMEVSLCTYISTRNWNVKSHFKRKHSWCGSPQPLWLVFKYSNRQLSLFSIDVELHPHSCSRLCLPEQD